MLRDASRLNTRNELSVCVGVYVCVPVSVCVSEGITLCSHFCKNRNQSECLLSWVVYIQVLGNDFTVLTPSGPRKETAPSLTSSFYVFAVSLITRIVFQK